MNKFLTVITLLLLTVSSSALDLTLYLNKGEVNQLGETFSVAAFNSDENLSSKNAIIALDVDELLTLTVINTDTLDHTLTIDGHLTEDNLLPAGESTVFELSFAEIGTYRYFSATSYGELIGASGVIHVGLNDAPVFSWNLFDLNREHTHALAATDATEMPAQYQPELFLINGRFFPETLEDPDALVALDLNEEAYITIVNSGYMDHVMHFHGFHIEVVSSQKQPERVGWSKDTIPVKSGEAMTVRLVANLEGVYPVHDHNLIAVTNTGFYPGGMITQIHVGQ